MTGTTINIVLKMILKLGLKSFNSKRLASQGKIQNMQKRGRI
jgi:hypothetical protein